MYVIARAALERPGRFCFVRRGQVLAHVFRKVEQRQFPTFWSVWDQPRAAGSEAQREAEAEVRAEGRQGRSPWLCLPHESGLVRVDARGRGQSLSFGEGGPVRFASACERTQVRAMPPVGAPAGGSESRW